MESMISLELLHVILDRSSLRCDGFGGKERNPGMEDCRLFPCLKSSSDFGNLFSLDVTNDPIHGLDAS